SSFGGLYQMMGDWETAAKYLRMALDLFTKLAAEFPSVTYYRYGLANSLGNWAEILMYRCELVEARKLLEQTLGHAQDLLKAFPESPHDAQCVVINNYLLACTLDALGESAKAAERRQAADQLLEETGSRLQKARGPAVAATWAADVAEELGYVV